MEVTAVPSATASQTIADLIPHAAERYGDRAAVRFKHDGDWQDVSYAELDGIVREIALGLIDLGIEPGERVCDPRQHSSRVVLRRPRRDIGRRGGRADLPDELARGVPLGHLRLRRVRDRLRGRLAAGEGRGDPRTAAAPAHDRHDRRALRGGATPELAALEAVPLEEVRARGAHTPPPRS